MRPVRLTRLSFAVVACAGSLEAQVTTPRVLSASVDPGLTTVTFNG